MSKFKKIILVLIALAFFGVLFLNFHAVSKPSAELTFTDTIPNQTTVYDFMHTLQTEGKITFTEKNYPGMGAFINSINGIKGNNNQAWIYYVDGVEAHVGVSSYKINPGDVVSWKYEESNY